MTIRSSKAARRAAPATRPLLTDHGTTALALNGAGDVAAVDAFLKPYGLVSTAMPAPNLPMSVTAIHYRGVRPGAPRSYHELFLSIWARRLAGDQTPLLVFARSLVDSKPRAAMYKRIWKLTAAVAPLALAEGARISFVATDSDGRTIADLGMVPDQSPPFPFDLPMRCASLIDGKRPSIRTYGFHMKGVAHAQAFDPARDHLDVPASSSLGALLAQLKFQPMAWALETGMTNQTFAPDGAKPKSAKPKSTKPKSTKSRASGR